ncbi:excisionase [Paraburkholderia dioscoreae]|uniref:Excisionase-like protein n=1 Tax=Paraburkholderia dioscoreae TaxID=2604047 RepID=A0A5Q4Z7X3_9BURK|nr:excisionase [Paraburkholderia dioscoreae]VVD29967.1 Excisionase-like protein [Paraburkholderia dioscoreae]
MKIRLDKWLEKEFDPPPKIRTARLWIKAGKIYPVPVKVGRSYYVEENAVFADAYQRPRLAERLFGNDALKKATSK